VGASAYEMGGERGATVLEWVGKEDFSTRDVCHCGVLIDYVSTAMRFEYAHSFKTWWVRLTASDGFQLWGSADPRADEGSFAGTCNGVDDNGLLEW
jgi:hypothetical protein